MEKDVFSIGILCYNNYEYIYEAIDSVLHQTYEKIQLIISDDASKEFCLEDIQEYIQQHKRENIVDVKININNRNEGTVLNAEKARKLAVGEFYMGLAADDALFDESVLQKYVEAFEKFGDNALIISSKVAMCTSELEDIVELVPSEEIICKIREFAPQKLFSYLSHDAIVPTAGTCYRMKIYEIIGGYDDDYFLIEDSPLFAKASRHGIKIHWLDIIGSRHRDGGIAHGNVNTSSFSYWNYRFDEVVYFKKEILPFLHLIDEEDLVLMQKKWQYIQYSYYELFVLPKELKSKDSSLFEKWTIVVDILYAKEKGFFKRILLWMDKVKMHKILLGILFGVGVVIWMLREIDFFAPWKTEVFLGMMGVLVFIDLAIMGGIFCGLLMITLAGVRCINNVIPKSCDTEHIISRNGKKYKIDRVRMHEINGKKDWIRLLSKHMLCVLVTVAVSILFVLLMKG